MNHVIWKAWLAAPVMATFAFATSASANDVLSQVSSYTVDGDSMAQVTSISQLRDVQPTDWAFQALQSLVERYGCIAGYPDGTYRGNRAMTRYEFAAGLNACLDRVNELIASATADLVTKEDLAVLQRLQEEFQAELATLRGRVDALEARTAELEANQFSTTTKLVGEAIFDIGSVFDGQAARPGVAGAAGTPSARDADDELTLGARLRLVLNTSFSGKDLLRTRLQVNNIQSYGNRFEGAGPNSTEFPGAGLGHQSGAPSTDVALNELWYRFPVGKAKVWVGALGVNWDKVVPFTGTYLPPSTELLQHFRYQGLYQVPSGAGIAASLPVSDAFNLTAGYTAADSFSGGSKGASIAGEDSGLTSGANSFLGQITFTPNKNLTIAAAYTRGYTPDGAGANGGIPGFGTAGAADPTGTQAATSDNFGISAGYRFSPAFNLSGWVNWSSVDAVDSSREADLLSWALQLGFPDLFRKGNYGALSFGALPYITDSSGAGVAADEDAPFAAQAFYSFKVSDNIAIQPGLIYITNPNGEDDNDNVWIGTVKTRFSF